MKIAWDSTPLHPPRTGIGQYSHYLLRAMTQAHVGTHFYLYSNRKLEVQWFDQACVSVRAGGFPPSRLAWMHLVLPWLGRRADADVWHFPNSTAPLLFGPPYVLTLHDLSLFRHPRHHPPAQHLTIRPFLRGAAQRAERVICVSEFTRGEAIDVLGLDHERIEVVAEAAGEEFRPDQDPVRLNEVRRKYSLPEEFLLFVGTLEPRKNISRLLRAYSQLKGQGHNVPLILVGPRGWNMPPVEEQVEKLGIGEGIRWLGYVPQQELPALYALAKVFVYPSLYEGFGLPLLEAMACGTPAVVGDCPALREVAGEAAIFVDPTDEAAISAGLSRLLSAHDALEHYRQLGLERSDQFSWQRAAQETFEVYERVAAGA